MTNPARDTLAKWRSAAGDLVSDHDSPTFSLAILAGLTLLGAILRLYLLADKSIWLDEAFSIFLSQRSLGDLLRLTAETDVHPPLYYLLLKVWLLLGDSAAHVRLLSALFSTAAIPLMYLVVSSLFQDITAGLIGAGILALSPLHIWYGQEARMFALLSLFALASAYFFIRALRHGLLRDWIAYVLLTLLALYTDYAAVWYVIAIAVFYLLARKHFPNRAKAWLISQAAILLLYLPWLQAFLRQTTQVVNSFWLSPPTFQSILRVFLDFNSFNFPWMALSILYMTVIFVWAYIVPGKGWQRPLATIWLFLPLLLSLLLSLWQPIFLTRNLILASFGYYILLTGTVQRFGSAKAAAILLLPLVAMNLISIGHNAWRAEKENWRDLVAHVAYAARNTQDGLVVFSPPYAELPFAYYFQQYDLALDTQGYPQDDLLRHPEPQQAGDAAALLAGRPYVWLVRRTGGSEETDDPVKAWLDANGYVRHGDFQRDNISVLGYTRWDLLVDKLPSQPAIVESGTKMYLPLLLQDLTTRPGPRIHVVQSGDTLYALARRYETTVEAILSVNQIANPNTIHVGQELIIP